MFGLATERLHARSVIAGHNVGESGWMWAVGGVAHIDGREKERREKEQSIMTGLGAALYGGFFGLAALWLFLTADRGPEPDAAPDQSQRPDRSNSESPSEAHSGSR